MNWDVEKAFTGHFTSATDDNIILSSRGCESHSQNFGGSFVLVLQQGRPKFLKYNSGLITRRCHKLRLAEGQDFLVCEDQWGAQGSAWFFVYAVEFGHVGESGITRIFETLDTTLTCGADVDGTPNGPVQQSRIKSVLFHLPNGNTPAGMSIIATLGKKQLDKPERDNCEQSLKKSGFQKASIEVLTKEYRIDFSFDGRSFVVVPASEATLKLFPQPQLPE